MELELTATHWRGYAQEQFPQAAWSVDGNVVRAIATGPRIDLISRGRFGDFVLSFDWRLPRGGNTAVTYRVGEESAPAAHTGPAMQLLDDEHHQEGADALTSCGALYGLMAPGGGGAPGTHRPQPLPRLCAVRPAARRSHRPGTPRHGSLVPAVAHRGVGRGFRARSRDSAPASAALLPA